MKVRGLTSVVAMICLTTGCVASEYQPRAEGTPAEFEDGLARLMGTVTVVDGLSVDDIIVENQGLTDEAIRAAILTMVAQSDCTVLGPVVGGFFQDDDIQATGVFRLSAISDNDQVSAVGQGFYKNSLVDDTSGYFGGDYDTTLGDVGQIQGGYSDRIIDAIGEVGVFGGDWRSVDLSARDLEFGSVHGLWIGSPTTTSGYIVGFASDCSIGR